MNDFLTVQQRSKLKQWWRRNAMAISLSTVIVVVTIGAWQWWDAKTQTRKVEAATLFDNFKKTLENKQTEQAQKMTAELADQFQDTVYLASARFLYARYLYEQSQPSEAANILQVLLDETDSQIIRELASNRLARLYIELNRADDALRLVDDQLEKVLGKSATSDLFIIQAEAYISQSKYAAARQALKLAQQNLPPSSPLEELITLRLNDIAHL